MLRNTKFPEGPISPIKPVVQPGVIWLPKGHLETSGDTWYSFLHTNLFIYFLFSFRIELIIIQVMIPREEQNQS